jgi:hypothetical protein
MIAQVGFIYHACTSSDSCTSCITSATWLLRVAERFAACNTQMMRDFGGSRCGISGENSSSTAL